MMHELPFQVDRFRRILSVNGHSYDGGKKIALFEHISIAQHACDSNAQYSSIAGLGVSRLFALQDLSAGDSVKICYLPRCGPLRVWPRWARQNELNTQFHFCFMCDLCNSQESHNPSRRSMEFSQALQALDDAWGDKEAFLSMAEELIRTTAFTTSSRRTI
ncbi:unnamed protein product [Prorocentrum cordatum]|uniref:SET domain-containing protein n=1 Tax=Prorocentrum cordatum TaxID=2364126 RepID=A0ABN9W8C2_9DINO|nr:unnamed protein product [Polarella glacialis]